MEDRSLEFEERPTQLALGLVAQLARVFWLFEFDVIANVDLLFA